MIFAAALALGLTFGSGFAAGYLAGLRDAERTLAALAALAQRHLTNRSRVPRP